MKDERYIKINCSQDEFDYLTDSKDRFYGPGKKQPGQGWKDFFMKLIAKVYPDYKFNKVENKDKGFEEEPKPEFIFKNIEPTEGEKLTAEELLNE